MTHIAFLFGLAFGALIMSIALTLGVDAVDDIARWRRDRLRRHVYRLPLPTCRVWGRR